MKDFVIDGKYVRVESIDDRFLSDKAFKMANSGDFRIYKGIVDGKYYYNWCDLVGVCENEIELENLLVELYDTFEMDLVD